MNFKKLLPLFILVIFVNMSFSQNENYGIIFPTSESQRDLACTSCTNAFNQKPRETNFSIKNNNGNLYFETNDKDWANKLFINPNDGLAIDVVSKDIYGCDVTSIDDKQVKGTLLKPVYAQQLKSGFKQATKDRYRVLVGKVPANLKGKELEYNILFLGNKTLCRYQVIFNLKNYERDILDMGIYLDDITLKDQKAISANGQKDERIRHKTLRFKIPFEKNKSVYSSEDIKPVYDSLNLTNFNIKTASIKAYSSIEGSAARNVQLQKSRANSIAKVIQTYQKSTIKTTISSSENWVEFLNDIKGTANASLIKLSKSEIKAKLVGSFSKQMEPVLKNHRKAIITLELIKKDKYEAMKPGDMVSLFNKFITDDNLKEASAIQNSLFEKIKNKDASIDILNQLKIPNELKYINLLNNNSVIKYQLDERQIVIVRDELRALRALDPNNPRINYNLTVIKLKTWRYNIEKINPENFKNEINNLKNLKISKNEINRILINYYITQSENYNRKRDYTNKDKSVNQLKGIYKKVKLSDYDYFNLAQFLSFYDSAEVGAEFLENKVRQIDIDQDLLFYYLNLTLVNTELTKTDNYRAIMLNAVNLDQARYCKMFSTPDKDGITFQLLGDDYLRRNYCESCIKN